MTTKIRILKDTPFDVAGTEITLEQFKGRYRWVFTSSITNEEMIQYLIEEYNCYLKYPIPNSVGSWFKVIDEPKFKIDDWVWHEKMQQAFYVIDNASGKHFWPNMATIGAVNENSDVYKRKATDLEIKYAILKPFCDSKLLVGPRACYYFDNVWKKLTGVEQNVKMYIDSINKFNHVVIESGTSYGCRFDGLRVGCTSVSHDDVLAIAEILNIK